MAEAHNFIACGKLPVVSTCGFRFWDSVTDSAVGDGLEVDAIFEGPFHRVIRAFRTGSGVFSFRGFPGLREAEYPQKGNPSAKAADARFVVRVRDRHGRFLPCAFRFEEKLPLEPPRIYSCTIFDVLNPGSPSGSQVIYLFPAAARPAIPGTAVVRGLLRDASEKDKPAAGAVVRVTAGGKKWYGVADDRGEAVVMFPYPPADRSLNILSPQDPAVSLASPFPVSPSPPPQPARPLYEESWSVSVAVLYSPATVTRLATGDPGQPETKMSDLHSVLRQRPALIATEPALAPALTELQYTLCYGSELVLRSGKGSELLIQAVETSP